MVVAPKPCVCVCVFLWVRRSASARIHILRPIAIASDLFSLSLSSVCRSSLWQINPILLLHIFIYLSSLFVASLLFWIYWIVVLLLFSFFSFIFLFSGRVYDICLFYYVFVLFLWCIRIGRRRVGLPAGHLMRPSRQRFQRFTFYYYYFIISE